MRRSVTTPALTLVVLAGLVAPALSASAAPHTPAIRTAVTPHPDATVDEVALTKRIGSYLASRDGSASVSFRDLATDQWYTYRPGRTYATASIVKVDILAALLMRHQKAGTAITKREKALASRMIRYSDNEATDILWTRIHGWKGLAAANRKLGLIATTRPPSPRWGGTRTTAADQVRLLRTLSREDCVLEPASRDYIFSLMRRVTTSQRWGVPAIADKRTVAKVKDGWAPQRVDDGRWEINSIGLVRVQGHLVAVSVLTRASPSRGYGQATVKQLTKLVGTALRDAG